MTCISTKFGGLGIRRVVDHANVAFAASWYESIRTAREMWIVLVVCKTEYVPQMAASSKVHVVSLDDLISWASARDAQRLRRSDFLHANAWISALPSAVDGKETVMEPRVYRTAVRSPTRPPCLPLLLPLDLSVSKPWIITAINAVCCRKSGDMITRHNRVRDLVADFAKKGLLSPEIWRNWVCWALRTNRNGVLEIFASKVWAPNRGLDY